MAHVELTAVYMKVPEGYIAFVEELPGANTQADTIEEARGNLQEAVSMVLEANRHLSGESLEGVPDEVGAFHAAGRINVSRITPALDTAWVRSLSRGK